MRIVFFGTPDPAGRLLRDLLSSSHEVAAVVTAPDRPAGRGMELKQSPVKEIALEASLAVMQPGTLKEAETASLLGSFDADVFIVVAYGLILPAAILDIPRIGCVNVHFSLLPRLRGAAPVQWAILQGESTTGVTIMKMDEGLDTGPILLQSVVEIGPHDTTGTLMERLTGIGGEILIRTLDQLEEGSLVEKPQDDSLATYAPKLTSVEARIDWRGSAEEIERRIRALNPNPGAWTERRGKRLKIWEAEPVASTNGTAGELDVRQEEMLVYAGTGGLRILEVQPEGSSRMAAAAYLRGYPVSSGEQLT